MPPLDPSENRELQRAQREVADIKFALDESAIVAITDRAGKILYVNNRFCLISQYSREELLGQTHAILKSGHHPDSFFKSMWETIVSGQVWRGEIKNKAKDNSFYWVDSTITPLMGEDGTPNRYVAIRFDITPRKKLEEDLRVAREDALAAARAKAEFLANMSHEIRTPLNGVIGLTSLMAASPLDPEQKRFVNTIQKSGETLLAIINDILDLSKIEAGKMTLESLDFSPRDILEDVLRVMTGVAQKKKIPLKGRVDPSVPPGAKGDPVRLRQILFNLIGNAVKFTEKGSVEVQISFREQLPQSLLRFEVVDTGIGLSPESQKKLFSPFSQADGSTTRKFGGTGLGLSISKKLIERMGGQIGVESEEGRGSTFWVQLPFEPAQNVPPPRGSVEEVSAAPPEVDAFGNGACVLVAEDNETNQLVISSLLRLLGFSVDMVNNGKLAVEKSAQGKYAAILMDCQMPEMDGYEAVKRIRARETPASVPPIIGVTAHAMEGDREKILAAGMDDCLTKPVQLQTVAAALRRWVQAPSAAPAAAALAAASHRPDMDESALAEIRELKTPEGKSLYKKVLETFQSETPKYLNDLKSAIKSSALEKIRLNAHTLKGTCRTVGAWRMGDLCMEIEKAAKSQDSRPLADLLNALEAPTQAVFQWVKERLEECEQKEKISPEPPGPANH